MNCALELLTIKATVLEEVAKAEEEKRLKEEQERVKRLAQRKEFVIANTKEWCETEINEKLLIEANSPSSPSISICIPVRFNDDWEEFIPLKKEISRIGNTYWSNASGWKNYATFINYLKKYCIKVERKWAKYPCCNLSPYTNGADLIISPDIPECL